MTNGLSTQGSTSKVGPYSRRSWNGTDTNHLTKPKGVTWSQLLGPIKDPWTGQVLTRKDGVEYEMARIRAKGIYLRSKRPPPASSGAMPPLNNYAMSRAIAFNAPVRRSDGTFYPYLQLFGGLSVTDPWDANDDLKLIDKFRSKILDSDLHVGVALAEIDKSMRMARESLTDLAWAVSAFRKGDIKGGINQLFAGSRARRARESGLQKNVLRNSADKELMWSYGIEPLVSDVDAAMRYVAYKLHGTRISRVVATRRIPTKVSPALPQAGSDPAFTYGFHSCRITAYLQHVDEVTLLGLLDVPSFLWERQWMSFVVDWVIPIGNYLSALNTVRALTGKYVVTHKTEAQWRPVNDTVFSGFSYTGCTAAWYREVSVNRKVFSNLNVPYPTVKPATRIASARHALNAASLLVSQLGRKATWL